MKITTIFLVSLITLNCFAGELVCEAWYQEKGMDIEKQTMEVASVTSKEKKVHNNF